MSFHVSIERMPGYGTIGIFIYEHEPFGGGLRCLSADGMIVEVKSGEIMAPTFELALPLFNEIAPSLLAELEKVIPLSPRKLLEERVKWLEHSLEVMENLVKTLAVGITTVNTAERR